MTTVLITGANRGIGLEFAKQYAEEGADVIACCRAPDKANALQALAKAKGIEVLPLDVTEPKSVEALKATLDGRPIDVLINNAGVGGPRHEPKNSIDFAGWVGTFKTNSIAPMLVAQALHDNLTAGKLKKLITITSMMGSISGHGGGAYAYRASKAAVNSVMHGLSKEWAKDGIVVGIFHPGWVKTDMGGASAPVTPKDSVTGLRAQIAKLSKANSGAYRDYTGQEIAW
ncbi:MAG TPA: SDR family oxidoreductase [Rhizomicrobium sp.]|jgi:NAD(P)-dependent dehydrogenase (short-subunit alcohol dehydrogenase family)|nr:SDR family oxidoreductase [Rhizomicrobium sp.]